MDTMRLEGNNGGDYIQITRFEMHPDVVHLEVGHCCIKEIDHIVPVEFLTSWLARAMMGSDAGIEAALRKSNWPKEFVRELIAKVEPRHEAIRQMLLKQTAKAAARNMIVERDRDG